MAVKKTTKPLTKTQLIAHLAETTDLPKKQVSELLDALLDIAYKEAKKEHGFSFPGLGKLVVVKRKARDGVNPATGEKIRIPAKKALKFRIAKAAKDAVTPPKAKK